MLELGILQQVKLRKQSQGVEENDKEEENLKKKMKT